MCDCNVLCPTCDYYFQFEKHYNSDNLLCLALTFYLPIIIHTYARKAAYQFF